jgi:hypothetical protein
MAARRRGRRPGLSIREPRRCTPRLRRGSMRSSGLPSSPADRITGPVGYGTRCSPV